MHSWGVTVIHPFHGQGTCEPACRSHVLTHITHSMVLGFLLAASTPFNDSYCFLWLFNSGGTVRLLDAVLPSPGPGDGLGRSALYWSILSGATRPNALTKQGTETGNLLCPGRSQERTAETLRAFSYSRGARGQCFRVMASNSASGPRAH